MIVAETLAIISLAAVAFFATNLDNLILLITLLNRFLNGRLQVFLGYLCGVIVAVTVGFFAAVVADRMPLEYLGYLGVIPLGLGLKGLFDLLPQGSKRQKESKQQRDRGLVILTAFLAQIGNSTDSIITFGVVYADTKPGVDWLVTSTLLGMGLLFAALASFAINHKTLGTWLGRYGRYVTPFILMYVGTYILMNTGTDALPG